MDKYEITGRTKKELNSDKYFNVTRRHSDLLKQAEKEILDESKEKKGRKSRSGDQVNSMKNLKDQVDDYIKRNSKLLEEKHNEIWGEITERYKDLFQNDNPELLKQALNYAGLLDKLGRGRKERHDAEIEIHTSVLVVKEFYETLKNYISKKRETSEENDLQWINIGESSKRTPFIEELRKIGYTPEGINELATKLREAKSQIEEIPSTKIQKWIDKVVSHKQTFYELELEFNDEFAEKGEQFLKDEPWSTTYFGSSTKTFCERVDAIINELYQEDNHKEEKDLLAILEIIHDNTYKNNKESINRYMMDFSPEYRIQSMLERKNNTKAWKCSEDFAKLLSQKYFFHEHTRLLSKIENVCTWLKRYQAKELTDIRNVIITTDYINYQIDKLKSHSKKLSEYNHQNQYTKIIQEYPFSTIEKEIKKIRDILDNKDATWLNMYTDEVTYKDSYSDHYCETPDSLYWKGVTLLRKNRHNEAIQFLTNAIENNPDNTSCRAAAYIQRASAFTELERHEEARKDCTEAIKLEPDTASHYIERATTYINLNMNKEARKDCTKAIELELGTASSYNKIAKAYFNLKKYKKALIYNDKAIEIDPSNASFYNNRANTHLSLINIEKALKDYNKAIEIDPSNASFYNNRAATYCVIGNPEKALKDYNKAIEIDPSDSLFYNNRSATYYELNNHEASLKDYKEMKRLESDKEAYTSVETKVALKHPSTSESSISPELHETNLSSDRDKNSSKRQTPTIFQFSYERRPHHDSEASELSSEAPTEPSIRLTAGKKPIHKDFSGHDLPLPNQHLLKIPSISGRFSLIETLTTITDLRSISNLSDLSHLSLLDENPTSRESITKSYNQIKKALTYPTLEILAYTEALGRQRQEQQAPIQKGKTSQAFKKAQDISYYAEKKQQTEQQEQQQKQLDTAPKYDSTYSTAREYTSKEHEKRYLPDQIAQQVTEIEKTLLRRIQALTNKIQKLANLEAQGHLLIQSEKAERKKITQSYTTLAHMAEDLATNAATIDTRTKEIYTTFLKSDGRDIKHLIQTDPKMAKPIIEIIHHYYESQRVRLISNRPYSGSKDASLETNAKKAASDLNTKPTRIESNPQRIDQPENTPPKQQQEKKSFLAQYLEPLMKIVDIYQSQKLSYEERFKRKLDEWQHTSQDHSQPHPQEHPPFQKPRSERARDLIQQLETQSPEQAPEWIEKTQTLYSEDKTLGHALTRRIQAFLEWSIDNTQMVTHQTQTLALEARRRANFAHNTYNDLLNQLSQEERELRLSSTEEQFKKTLKEIKADYQATRTYRINIENLYKQKEETFYHRHNTDNITEYKDNNNNEQGSNSPEYEEINDNIADLLSSNIDHIIQKMQNEINHATKTLPSELSSSLNPDSPNQD